MVDEERWLLLWAHRDRLLAVARRRTACREDAEDVVMEAILRCAEYAALDESRAGALLTTVTVNGCADVVRKARTRSNARFVLAHAADGVEAGPEETVCAAAEARWLARRAASLPHRERAVLLARADGTPDDAIAAALAATPRAVESALTRARRKLRRALAEADARGR